MFIKMFSIKSQRSSAVSSFLLYILPNNSRKVVSRSTLYGGHFPWGHFLQRTHFWISLGQQLAIDEMKKYLKRRNLYLTLFYSLPIKNLDQKKKFLICKKMRYLKKSVLYFVDCVPWWVSRV